MKETIMDEKDTHLSMHIHVTFKANKIGLKNQVVKKLGIK